MLTSCKQRKAKNYYSPGMKIGPELPLERLREVLAVMAKMWVQVLIPDGTNISVRLLIARPGNLLWSQPRCRTSILRTLSNGTQTSSGERVITQLSSVAK
jgi:hypothetical protein